MISGLGAVMPHEKRDDDLDGMLSPRSEVESRERASSTGSGTGLVDPWAITDVRFPCLAVFALPLDFCPRTPRSTNHRSRDLRERPSSACAADRVFVGQSITILCGRSAITNT
jgi:hypothetical protein